MKFYKKIVILMILAICGNVVYYLLLKRKELTLENFTADISEVNRIMVKTGPGIRTSDGTLALREYCIKSSYNTAVSGQYVSIDAIKYVLSRGCRFLDFEIFLINDIPCVAYSTDITFITISTKNTITLSDVFKSLIIHGFGGPSPNGNDPLFVQLRIKSTNVDIFNLIGGAIENTLKDVLYQGNVTKDTPLDVLKGKLLLVVDAELAKHYPDGFRHCSPHCYEWNNYIHLKSNCLTLRKYTYRNLENQYFTPPAIVDTDLMTSDIQLFRIIEPSVNETSNPECMDFIINHGVQLIPNRFYITDKNLEFYETFFLDNHSAFVPMTNAIEYFNSLL